MERESALVRVCLRRPQAGNIERHVPRDYRAIMPRPAATTATVAALSAATDGAAFWHTKPQPQGWWVAVVDETAGSVGTSVAFPSVMTGFVTSSETVDVVGTGASLVDVVATGTSVVAVAATLVVVSPGMVSGVGITVGSVGTETGGWVAETDGAVDGDGSVTIGGRVVSSTMLVEGVGSGKTVTTTSVSTRVTTSDTTSLTIDVSVSACAEASLADDMPTAATTRKVVARLLRAGIVGL